LDGCEVAKVAKVQKLQLWSCEGTRISALLAVALRYWFCWNINILIFTRILVGVGAVFDEKGHSVIDIVVQLKNNEF
jgi:hypothetical protein